MAVWRWPQSRIHNVVDGDTVDSVLSRVVTIDVGFGIKLSSDVTLPSRLRLARINTARSGSVKGRAATARVRALTADVALDITTVKTYKYGGPEDKVGEYVAEITLTDGRNLSDLLVSEGLATYWNGQGPRPDDE